MIEFTEIDISGKRLRGGGCYDIGGTPTTRFVECMEERNSWANDPLGEDLQTNPLVKSQASRAPIHICVLLMMVININ